MRWQQARGVLNSLYDDNPGSPWWRAVNEDLLRDSVEAKLLIQLGVGEPSRPSVARWVGFFNAPSALSWYGAHNASVVAGYLAHAALASLEAPAERFFMNVVLVRVLYAHALVLDGDLALGRLSFLAGLIGHPRSRGPQALLAAKDVLPDRYPIHGTEVEELINAESRLGRMMDYGVIGVRVDALYAASAGALGEPRLLELVVDGAPAYAWPADQRHVWKPQSQARFTSLIEFLTRPACYTSQATVIASRSITSVAARSPERTAPSMNPYMMAEDSVPAQWMRPQGSRRAGPYSVSTPGGVWAIIPPPE
jgi:hypothetical protein